MIVGTNCHRVPPWDRRACAQADFCEPRLPTGKTEGGNRRILVSPLEIIRLIEYYIDADKKLTNF